MYTVIYEIAQLSTTSQLFIKAMLFIIMSLVTIWPFLHTPYFSVTIMAVPSHPLL